MAALQAGAKGSQACINAADSVKGIISYLDTVIMFASTGLLNKEGDTFGDHRENILRTAKSLVEDEDTKKLVSGAAASQEQLASAAEASAGTIRSRETRRPSRSRQTIKKLRSDIYIPHTISRGFLKSRIKPLPLV